MPEQDALRATHFIHLKIQGPAFVNPVWFSKISISRICVGAPPI